MTNLFEKFGGEATVSALVYTFYNKILMDDRINKFFDDTNMDRLVAKQKEFLCMVLGGPNPYTGKGLRDAHASLVKQGLNDSHFDAVLEHLSSTLSDMGVGSGDIKSVIDLAESTRKDVLGR